MRSYRTETEVQIHRYKKGYFVTSPTDPILSDSSIRLRLSSTRFNHAGKDSDYEPVHYGLLSMFKHHDCADMEWFFEQYHEQIRKNKVFFKPIEKPAYIDKPLITPLNYFLAVIKAGNLEATTRFLEMIDIDLAESSLIKFSNHAYNRATPLSYAIDNLSAAESKGLADVIVKRQQIIKILINAGMNINNPAAIKALEGVKDKRFLELAPENMPQDLTSAADETTNSEFCSQAANSAGFLFKLFGRLVNNATSASVQSNGDILSSPEEDISSAARP